MGWYLAVLRNYLGFGGRARRREYWSFTAINLVAAAMVVTLGQGVGAPWLLDVYATGTAFPALAVVVRRLHDTGRSGWVLLIAIVPIVGVVALLVLLCLDSQPGPNRFGLNPKIVPVRPDRPVDAEAGLGE